LPATGAAAWEVSRAATLAGHPEISGTVPGVATTSFGKITLIFPERIVVAI
jgi:hypothetical protein